MTALIARSAAAQDALGPLAPFQLRLTSAATWDANVFRLADSAPDPQAALGKPGKSDRSTSTTFGIAFDKPYAQQRFVANIFQTAVRYDKFTSLNRDASNYSAQWLWQLTPRISGTLGTDHSESSVGFQDITVGQRLITTSNDNNRFTIDGWLFGGWHLLAGASQSKLRNGQAFVTLPSTDQTNEEVGIKYVATSQSYISATRRWSRGLYPGQERNLSNLVDTGFRVRETELNASWIVSGRSTLIGRLTVSDRRYDRLSQLDFSGTSGEIRYVWLPTGGLTLNASASRAVAPFLQVPTAGATGASYRVDNTLALSPVWQVTGKTTLNMSLSRMTTDYLGSVGVAAGPERRDTSRRLSIGAVWAAHPKVTISANLQRERRTSTQAAFQYDDTVAGVTASLAY